MNSMIYNKVLIAEDHEVANLSVRRTLEELKVDGADYVYYCDDAMQRINKALELEQPYQLLITDLHFEEDNRQQALSGGEDLVRAAKIAQPSLKVIVFSAESRPAIIHGLFESLSIDGYVRKARRDAQAIKDALLAVASGKKYMSPHIKQSITNHNVYEFSTFDITIIALLADGIFQKDIPFYLKQKNITPSGLSSVEKRLNAMKEIFGFTKNEQLVAHCKDLGVL